MTEHLVLTIRLHDARYHGRDEWPPAPARVFQALMAGCARGAGVPDDAKRALAWLEAQPAPVIAAPHARLGQSIDSFVPNNDADSGSAEKVSKEIVPRLLDGDEPFIYAWGIESAEHIDELVTVAEQVYQFGRGVDMAWASAEIVTSSAFAERLAKHRGPIHRPTGGDGGISLACPTVGSMKSLERRFGENMRRLRAEGEGRSARYLFVQPPKARFTQVTYDAPAWSRTYELRRARIDAELHPWPLTRCSALVETLRDAAAAKLRAGLPDRAEDIERFLIGRKADGRDAAPPEQRVRIIPLPSIGHEHADRAIRRVRVEVPWNAPISPADVHWALSGIAPSDPTTGELKSFVLTPTDDVSMLRHYTRHSRVWRTITPAALPDDARRRRIEPSRRIEEAKGASERVQEEARAIAATRAALRHAGVLTPLTRIHVQREPFQRRGARAEPFAEGTRFAKERLWHVELESSHPVSGPMLLGDGRFLGLGLLEPVSARDTVFTFEIESGLAPRVDPVELARALRRAVIARAQQALGRRPLPAFFTGHEPDGRPAQDAAHLAFHYDLGSRLVVAALGDVHGQADNLELLAGALASLQVLRAGSAGKLVLRGHPPAQDDPLLAAATTWSSATPYLVNRHRKAANARGALVADAVAACLDAGLPEPDVAVDAVSSVLGRGLSGWLTLRFPVAIPGPLMLGRSRYIGGGLFIGRARA